MEKTDVKFRSVGEFGRWIRNKTNKTDEDIDMVMLSVLLEMQRSKVNETQLFKWMDAIGKETGLLIEGDGSYTEQFKRLLDSVESLRMKPGYMVALHEKYKELFQDGAIKEYLENTTVN